MSIQYLTQKGHNDLEAEYKNLKDKKIPDIATRIDEAKQQGDLSENAEYHVAKEEMAWAQGRLLDLKAILNNAQIVQVGGQGKNGQNNIVSIGCTVGFTTPSGHAKEYTIVGPTEADPLNGRISNESPLGESFIGKKVGDKVIVNTPAGKQEYKIVKIN